MEQQGDFLRLEYFTFGGPAFIVSLHDSVLHYEWYRNGVFPPADKQVELSPDRFAWQDFWTQVQLVGAWYWRGEYDGYALDGEEWRISLAHEGKRLDTRLVNAYPPKGERYPSEAFKQFLKAVGELLDDRDFVNYWYYNETGGVSG